MWLSDQDSSTKELFTNQDTTFEDLETAIDKNVAAENFKIGNGYGLSKAGLNALTLIQAKSYPELKITSLTPGFIDTPMTKGIVILVVKNLREGYKLSLELKRTTKVNKKLFLYS